MPSLTTLFHPSSIALIGASGDPNKLAGRTLNRLQQHDFPGEIYLVNPHRDKINGRRCYRSISDVPGDVDVAFISLPASVVPDTIRECGRAGVAYAVVISSGFGEEAGASDLTEELDAAVRESGVRLVGPNCEGIWSIPSSMALTFGSAANRRELLEGGVSVISQSGSIGGAVMSRLQDAGVGARYFVSSGNETDLSSMDFLEYLVDEGDSMVIAMFVEGFRDGYRLQAIARRAAAAGIRLVALCAGASKLGRIATLSHTGRIATTATVYRDMLDEAGVLQVDTVSQFVEAIEAAQIGRVTAPSADDLSGVSIIALSGGSRALLADSCERLDMPIATFSPETEAALVGMLPPFAYARNPTDLTGQVVSDPELFSRVLETVLADPRTEALVVQYANGADHQISRQLDFYRDFAANHDKPVIVSVLGNLSAELQKELRASGVIAVGDPQKAIEVIGWLGRWRDLAEHASAVAEPVTLGATQPVSTWAEQMAFLEASGIPVPAWTLWADGQDDLGDLSFPLVLKALPESFQHKTEVGLVFVGLRDQAELDAAVATFHSRAPKGTPMILQEMVEGAVELLLTARFDPDFGPILAIGAGGVQAEWLKDIGYVPLPATGDQVRRALQRRRVWELLQPFRGRSALDIDAVIGAAVGLGNAYLSRLERGSEVEINPLMVSTHGAWAVDILCSAPGGQEALVGAEESIATLSEEIA